MDRSKPCPALAVVSKKKNNLCLRADPSNQSHVDFATPQRIVQRFWRDLTVPQGALMDKW